MKLTFGSFALAVLIVVTSSAWSFAQSNPTALPNPILYFLGQEPFSNGGTNFIRYRYGVLNAGSYPDTLFAAAPALPACGLNTKAARTWVDIYDDRGKRLNGFCALGKSDNLNGIWFALPEGAWLPSWIYIELNDRQTATKYKSNLAETTL